MTESITETIGCDLGDKQSEICILLPSGELRRPSPVKTTRKAFTEFFTRPRGHVIIEVGTHSRWVSELLKELGHKVTVANPRRVQLISRSDQKRDGKDAELLARLGRADQQLLSPIQHRGRKAQSHVPVGLRPALEPLFATLVQLELQIKKLDQRIEQIAQKYPDVEVIAQPKGVGTLTALVFLLTLEDKTRFTKSRMVGAFIGLNPRRDQSGDTDKQLGITKAGDTYLRRLAVSSANYILGPFGEDSDLRRWGLALATRGGKNAKKRAKVAVARKLVVLLHRLWVTGEIYQPLGYAKEQQAA